MSDNFVLCRSGDKRGGDSDSDEEDSEKSKLKSQLEGRLCSVSNHLANQLAR